MISCPACAGVIRAEISPHDHIEFVCSVGHAFSLEDLYQAKEEQLEEGEWSVMAFLKHIQMILGMTLDANAKSTTFTVQEVQKRLEQVTRQIAVIERLIQETEWPKRRASSTAKEAFQGIADE